MHYKQKRCNNLASFVPTNVKNRSEIDEISCAAGIQPHDPSKIGSRASRGSPKEGSEAPQEGPGPLPSGLGSGPGPSRTLKLAPSLPKLVPSWTQVGSWEPSWGHLWPPGLPPGPTGTLQGLPGPSGSPTDPPDRCQRPILRTFWGLIFCSFGIEILR